MTEIYLAQSPVTDPGPYGSWVADLPSDITALRDACSQLVFHYWAGGDFDANHVPQERVAEIDLRYVDEQLALLKQRADKPLSDPREPANRVVGCCRDSAALNVSFLRAHGIPARSRVGFAGYLGEGWWLDHVVADVWDAESGRWRRVDADLPGEWTDAGTGQPLDLTDVGQRFLTGAEAWRACRDGSLDAERFAVSPDIQEPFLRSWPYLAHNLVLDLAALGSREMILWDEFGLLEGPVTDELLPLLDELAAAIVAPDVDPAVVDAWLQREEFRIGEQIASYSPRNGPRRVTLRPGLAS